METRPLLLFAPGAGAPSSHPWMQRWSKLLGRIGFVRTFDYDYMQAGRSRPNRLPELISAHKRALDQACQEHSGPVVLIGKSMGSRIGCHVALEESVAALVCLGYPLCGGGDRAKLRDKVLLQLQTPIVFVQGTRDPLCPLDLLAEVRAGMQAPNELYVVDGGDHSLLVTKTQLKLAGDTQETVNERILLAIQSCILKYTDRAI